MGTKQKVPPSYSRADLPIHAKIGREWGPEKTRARLTAVGMTSYKKFTLTLELR